jgi:mortality factor 4-like protein 1
MMLVPLPSQAPANFIIDEYFNEEKNHRRLGSAEADILEEFCAGLKMYFDKAVGKILLYRFERAQLAEVSTMMPANPSMMA